MTKLYIAFGTHSFSAFVIVPWKETSSFILDDVGGMVIPRASVKANCVVEDFIRAKLVLPHKLYRMLLLRHNTLSLQNARNSSQLIISST